MPTLFDYLERSGNGAVVTSQEIATALVEGFAAIPQARSITIPTLDNVRGLPIKGGSPLELYGVISSIKAARKALRHAGRPGLPILNLCPAATTATGTIAGCYPSVGARPSDGWLVDYLAEMTIDFTNLKTQKQSEEYARLYEEVLNELIQMGIPFEDQGFWPSSAGQAK